MVPKQAPVAPSITDTPATPIEPLDTPFVGRIRSRSQQWLDTFIQEARSRSSSASSRHSRSSDNVKGVIVKLGLAAGTVGADHIKSAGPHDENVVEGLKVFLSALQNILRQAKTGGENDVETIEVDGSTPLDLVLFTDNDTKVHDDTRSENAFHPITEAKENPFGTSTEAGNGDAADPASPIEQHFGSLSREESFGEFVTDIFMYEKESGHKVPGRARLDTGMTCNAIRYSHAEMVGYPIQDYHGEPCIIGDGTLFSPLGQVTLPFHFVNSGNAKTWHVEFLVFPDGSPFDICLGRRFISVADLLKRNPEALPVELRKLKRSEELENRHKTYHASSDSGYTREKEDNRYDSRRRPKPKEKEPRKW